jgi:hypothetical protein
MILLPNRIVWWFRKVFWFGRNINNRGDDYDFDFACNGLIMAGAECIIRWRKTEFFKKAAELNACSSLVYLGAVYLGFGFVSDWEIW